ncbi:MAG: hypothetical protein ACRC2T_18335 [Thermoguttaceae bacterium]
MKNVKLLLETSSKNTKLNMIYKTIFLPVPLILLGLAFCCGNTIAYSEDNDYSLAELKLDGFEAQNGYAPTDSDFFSIILKTGGLTYEEIALLYQKVKQANHSNITKDNLLKLIKAKRDSLKDFHCQYKINHNTGMQSFESEIDYAMKGKKIYLDQSMTDNRKKLPRRTVSFDGSTFYNYTHPDQEGQVPFVGISENIDYQAFYEPMSPISLSMLLDSKLFDKTFSYINDLIVFLECDDTFVCEKKEVIDGKECVVISNWYTKAWLAPDLDFSPIQVEDYSLLNKESANGADKLLTNRVIIERRNLSDLVDCGNGIWLPSKTIIQYFNKNGSPSEKTIISVSSMKINSGLKDSVFSSFIPDDALIADHARSLVYANSDRPSIGALLKSTVKSKVVTTFRWLSVIAGLVLIAVALVMKYRNYRNNRSTPV